MRASTIVLRAHTELANKDRKGRRKNKAIREPKWPDCILVMDPETRTDEKQNLTFGPYRIVFADENGQYTNVRQEGFFYDPNELNPHKIDELTTFSKREKAETAPDVSKDLRLLTREEFLKQIFFPLAVNGALIVGFNLPFDISV